MNGELYTKCSKSKIMIKIKKALVCKTVLYAAGDFKVD